MNVSSRVSSEYLSSWAFHTGSHLEEGWFAMGIYIRPETPRVVMLREPGHGSGVESLGYSDRQGRAVWTEKPVTSKGTLDVRESPEDDFNRPETHMLLNATQSRAWVHKEQDLPPDHAEAC